VTQGKQPPHRDIEAPGCPHCTAIEPLRSAVEELLGDPIADAVALLDADAFKEAFQACAPAERSKILGDLGIPPMRNLPTAAATHALTLLRRGDQVLRDEACRLLTWPVRSSLLADAAINRQDALTLTREQVCDALTRILQRWDQALVRLALVTAWNGPQTTASPVFLEVTLTDERLCLGAWTQHAAELARQCQEAVARLAVLASDKDADHPYEQGQAGRSDTPTRHRPDTAEPDQTDQARPPATNSTSSAAASDTADDALARARAALADSQATTQRVLDRLAAHRPPQPDDLETLAALRAAFAAAAAALLPDHADPSLPELKAAAAAHARDQRQALQRIMLRSSMWV
jgi:hypothetical protein